jgi:non-homologous end joining protein Ku
MKLWKWEIRRAGEFDTPREIERDIAINAADQIWCSANKRTFKIADMENSHAKHVLALIVRNLRKGQVAFTDISNPQSPVKFSDVMEQLKDGHKAAFIGDKLITWMKK